MALKLHTCTKTWIHGPHPCWRAMKALDEAGIPYEQVKHPARPRSRRRVIIAMTGQELLPVIEFEDGTVLREETRNLVARIGEGRLEGSGSPPLS